MSGGQEPRQAAGAFGKTNKRENGEAGTPRLARLGLQELPSEWQHRELETFGKDSVLNGLGFHSWLILRHIVLHVFLCLCMCVICTYAKEKRARTFDSEVVQDGITVTVWQVFDKDLPHHFFFLTPANRSRYNKLNNTYQNSSPAACPMSSGFSASPVSSPALITVT